MDDYNRKLAYHANEFANFEGAYEAADAKSFFRTIAALARSMLQSDGDTLTFMGQTASREEVLRYFLNIATVFRFLGMWKDNPNKNASYASSAVLDIVAVNMSRFSDNTVMFNSTVRQVLCGGGDPDMFIVQVKWQGHADVALAAMPAVDGVLNGLAGMVDNIDGVVYGIADMDKFTQIRDEALKIMPPGDKQVISVSIIAYCDPSIAPGS